MVSVSEAAQEALPEALGAEAPLAVVPEALREPVVSVPEAAQGA